MFKFAPSNEGFASDALSSLKSAVKDIIDQNLGFSRVITDKLVTLSAKSTNDFNKDAEIKTATSSVNYTAAKEILVAVEQALASEMQFRETHDCAKIKDSYEYTNKILTRIKDLLNVTIKTQTVTAEGLGYTSSNAAEIARTLKNVFVKLVYLKLQEKGELKANILSDEDKKLELSAKTTAIKYYAELYRTSISAIFKILVVIEACYSK